MVGGPREGHSAEAGPDPAPGDRRGGGGTGAPPGEADSVPAHAVRTPAVSHACVGPHCVRRCTSPQCSIDAHPGHHNSRSQEYDTRMEHMVFLMHKADHAAVVVLHEFGHYHLDQRNMYNK